MAPTSDPTNPAFPFKNKATVTKTKNNQQEHPTAAAEAPTPRAAIRVIVNNRLGVRSEIVCSPDDTIGDFERLAALYLGMRPESIILKRQAQRPMRDFLTLGDYGIGDGAAVDLEVDTRADE